eukprot:gene12548-biopygen4781
MSQPILAKQQLGDIFLVQQQRDEEAELRRRRDSDPKDLRPIYAPTVRCKGRITLTLKCCRHGCQVLWRTEKSTGGLWRTWGPSWRTGGLADSGWRTLADWRTSGGLLVGSRIRTAQCPCLNMRGFQGGLDGADWCGDGDTLPRRHCAFFPFTGVPAFARVRNTVLRHWGGAVTQAPPQWMQPWMHGCSKGLPLRTPPHPDSHSPIAYCARMTAKSASPPASPPEVRQSPPKSATTNNNRHNKNNNNDNNKNDRNNMSNTKNNNNKNNNDDDNNGNANDDNDNDDDNDNNNSNNDDDDDQ